MIAKLPLLGILMTALWACGDKQAVPAAVDDSPTLPEVATPHPEPAIDAQVAVAPVDASVAAVATPPVPNVPLEASTSWPFYAWDKAQSYTFNLQRPGPGVRLRVYSESQGWTLKPKEGPTLSATQAQKALSLILKTQGQMIVSKCPFPRHGIVFFQKEVPVGSISVCFECGDIMIWPPYSQDPQWDEKKSKRFGKLMKAYDRVFPQWTRFFEADLGLASDWTKLPKEAGQ